MDGLCEDCKRRTTTNPLRVLDCKKRDCKALVQDAPSILGSLCADCDIHFAAVRKQLEILGVTYKLNRFMVRGLDYYTRTTFEFLTADLGAQSAVAAGGRYDGLIEQLGGPKNLSGIGFAMGIERLALLMQQKEKISDANQADIFIAALGETAIAYSGPLIHQLRKLGRHAAMDYSNRSLKAQMKQAGRTGARYTLIIGEHELEQHEGVLRNMQNHEQVPFPLQGTLEQQSKQLSNILK